MDPPKNRDHGLFPNYWAKSVKETQEICVHDNIDSFKNNDQQYVVFKNYDMWMTYTTQMYFAPQNYVESICVLKLPGFLLV